MISARKVAVLSGAASLTVIPWLSVTLVGSCLPSVWRFFVSCLQPPYVYVLLNGIIFTIAASSRLVGRGQSTEAPPLRPNYHEDDFVSASVDDLSEMSEPVSACESNAGSGVGEDEGWKKEEEEPEVFQVLMSVWTPMPQSPSPVVKREETENVLPEGGLGGSSPADKPLVSSKLSHRRPVKLSSPEGGKVLGVTKPRSQETLENTWRSITEGRPMPLTRHLKKCETSSENRGSPTPTSPPDPKAIKISETFRDRTNEIPMLQDQTAGSRKEAAVSPSRDELNRRVEDFIRKFNEGMRLQRQESLDQYRGMIASRPI